MASGYNDLRSDNFYDSFYNLSSYARDVSSFKPFRSRHVKTPDRTLYTKEEDCQNKGVSSVTLENTAPYIGLIAMDIGTSFSGYAFSFNQPCAGVDTDDIHVKRTWGERTALSQNTTKAPTCILLNEDMDFEAFGYEAQEIYSEMQGTEKEHLYYYFDKFKMVLYKENNKVIDPKLKLTAANGKQLPAIDVFVHVMKYMKDDALKLIETEVGDECSSEQFIWLITVPAIWQPSAKVFMRDAAYKANLVSKDTPNQLIIALEPEAASLYCRSLKMKEFVNENGDGAVVSSMESIHLPYMVVDCGGGTVDITVHKINEDNATAIREIYKASGGNSGGTKVDQEFENLLYRVFGKMSIQNFKRDHPAKWLEVISDFEIKKRSDKMLQEKRNQTRIRIPGEFSKLRKSSDSTEDVNIVDEYLIIGANTMQALFSSPVRSIKEYIGNILGEIRQNGIHRISCIFLVGGFSASPLLQKSVREMFSNYRILVPRDCVGAVVKGAVMFGRNPDVITCRICPRTYGTETATEFKREVHDVKHMFTTSLDKVYCGNIFHKLVGINEEIYTGEVKLFTFFPIEPNQENVSFHFYTTTEDNAVYTVEEHVKVEGTEIELDSPDTTKGIDRTIELAVEFGGTEIKVTAKDVETGKAVKAYMNLSA
ncbi:heat shock 70 kDa protein 12A-like [Glandiceps talaboti]